MICPTCRGRQFLAEPADDDESPRMKPCPDCIGGVAYCCEGPSEAEIERSQARIAAVLGADPYRDEGFLERMCDRCGKPYQGPAVYCSLECAIADA